MSAPDLDAALAAYVAWWESMTPATVADVARFGAPGMRFKDPFNDARGIERVRRVVASTFAHGAPRLEVLARARSGSVALLLWRFTLERPGATTLVIRGMSEIRFDEAGRVAEHVDHWDAAEQFHERLPGIGWLLRRIKARLATT